MNAAAPEPRLSLVQKCRMDPPKSRFFFFERIVRFGLYKQKNGTALTRPPFIMCVRKQ
jgi:hypothetical protein